MSGADLTKTHLLGLPATSRYQLYKKNAANACSYDVEGTAADVVLSSDSTFAVGQPSGLEAGHYKVKVWSVIEYNVEVASVATTSTGTYGTSMRNGIIGVGAPGGHTCGTQAEGSSLCAS